MYDDVIDRLRVILEADASRLVAALRSVRGELKTTERESDLTAGKIRSAIGAYVGFQTVTGVIRQTVGAASSLNEQTSRLQQTFRSSAGDLQRWAQANANAYGLSERAAVQYASTFGGLIQNMGVGEQEAANWARRLVTLAADMASFGDTSLERALDAINSGLIGEVEPLRYFSVMLSESAVQQEAVRLGLVKEGQELDNNARIRARYSIILRDTSRQHGDFARTSDGVANSTRKVQAALEDAAAVAGKPMLEPVAKALKEITDTLKEPATQEALRDFGVSLGEGIKDLAHTVATDGPGIVQTLGDIIDVAREAGDWLNRINGWVSSVGRAASPIRPFVDMYQQAKGDPQAFIDLRGALTAGSAGTDIAGFEAAEQAAAAQSAADATNQWATASHGLATARRDAAIAANEERASLAEATFAAIDFNDETKRLGEGLGFTGQAFDDFYAAASDNAGLRAAAAGVADAMRELQGYQNIRSLLQGQLSDVESLIEKQRRADLTSALGNLPEQARAATAEVERYQGAIEGVRKAQEGVNRAIADEEKARERLKAQRLGAEVAPLQARYDAGQQRIQAEQDRLSGLSRMQAHLNELIAAEKDRLDAAAEAARRRLVVPLEAQLARESDAQDRLRERIDAVTEASDRIGERIQRRQAFVDDMLKPLQERADAAKNAVAALYDQLSSIDSREGDLKDRFQRIAAGIERLQYAGGGDPALISRLRAQQDAIRREYYALQDQEPLIAARIQTQEPALLAAQRAAEAALKAGQQRAEALLSPIEAWKAQQEALAGQRDALNDQLKDSQKRAADLRKRIDDLKQSIEEQYRTSQKLEEYEARNERLSRQIRDQRYFIEDLTGAQSALKRRIDDVTESINEQFDKGEHARRIEQLNAQKEAQDAQLRSLNTGLAGANERQRSLNQKIDRINAQFSPENYQPPKGLRDARDQLNKWIDKWDTLIADKLPEVVSGLSRILGLMESINASPIAIVSNVAGSILSGAGGLPVPGTDPGGVEGSHAPLSRTSGKGLFDAGQIYPNDPAFGGLQGTRHKGWDVWDSSGNRRVYATLSGIADRQSLGYDIQGAGVRDHLWHLVNMQVPDGAYVKAGTYLGDYAQVGLSNTPHLHWERWINGVLQQNSSAYGLPDSVLRYGNGGWINEHVVGIGLQSGRGYEIAENGPEYVVGGGKHGSPVNNHYHITGYMPGDVEREVARALRRVLG